ncbi:filamentous hemagglutinin N-terminal domain-containing protein [Orbus sturtevantii]|uniref:two-partner secretion domain-containing protein n=1 Tax=Orbus sturtevantii TaxID=3074109 RepID=UPI00370D3D0E
MNKHFYRIIFNKARGIMMVVAEIVKRHQGEGRSSQKATRTASSGKVTAALKPLSFLTFVALGMVSIVTQSQASTIISDNSAGQSQRPIIIERPNGPTVVNIQEANKAGVSHNKYNQFDVSREGVILNNSAQSSNTQLGGNIAGNSNLANSGGAKVILNEINSANASQLNGKIEVAGQKAQVVIANAAGITCNGCGFINADRATLTTGSAIFGEDGTLQGYRVEQGNITINGEFDSREQDYTGLIARTVNINGQIHANQMMVVAGKNKVTHYIRVYDDASYDNVSVDKIYSDDEKPQLAIDVAALGGMYANKITLTSTETGVGVRNAGALSASHDPSEYETFIKIAATGKITNTGQIYVKHYPDEENLQNTENKNISAKRTTTQTTNSDSNATLYDESTIQSEEDYYVDYNSIHSYTSLVTSGEIVNEGDIHILGNGGFFTLEGKQGINNKGNIEVLTDPSIYTDTVRMISEKVVNNSGSINVEGSFQISSRGDIYNTSKIKAKDIYFYGDNNIVNAGQIAADRYTDFETQNFNNRGYITGNTGQYLVDGTFNNDGNITMDTELFILAQNLYNNGGLKSHGEIMLSTDMSILNDNGVNEGEMVNRGTIEADKALNIAVNKLNNYDNGKISSGGVLNIGNYLEYHFYINEYGELVSTSETVEGKAQSINNQSGTIEAKGDLTIGAEQINNSGKIKSAKNMNLALTMLNNTDGTIFSGGALNIGKDLNEDGTITGRATMVNNLSGSIEAADDITIDALYYLYSTD